ncbi:MAG: hypothetical protein Q9222_001699 [Ikaeria aurantiellina]
MEAKTHVVIVGGSLAGLMQGIVVKRLGHDVTILEQYQSSTRDGQAAGIVTMEHSQRFLHSHDLLKDHPYAVDCSAVQILGADLKVKHEFQRPMKMSSWNVLYYRLRANFDGHTSQFCPQAPVEAADVGKPVYAQGKRAIQVHLDGDALRLGVEDQLDHTMTAMKADKVIVADGSSSQMRGLLQPQLKHEYAGYVAWRGTVEESNVSEKTRSVFQNKTTLHSTNGGYVALYTIPGESGSLQSGQRLLNYVWYTNIDKDSKTLQEAMTDINGQQHRQTLPIGKMQSKVWDRQRQLAHEILPSSFAELVDKTTQPFISVISDIDVSQPVFFGGKLLFVGDALMPFRPHVACSTNQAALNALLMERLLKGVINLSSWETQVLNYAHATRLQSITWGCWYQIGYLAFFRSEAVYLATLFRQGMRGWFLVVLYVLEYWLSLPEGSESCIRAALLDFEPWYMMQTATTSNMTAEQGSIPLSAGLVTTAVLAVSEGAGQHIREVPPANIGLMLKVRSSMKNPMCTRNNPIQGYIAAEITWIAANTAIKTSVLHFYLSLFYPNRKFRLIAFSLIGLVISFFLGVLLTTFLNCRPLSKTWTPNLPGTCGSLVGNLIGTTVVNVVIDMGIILLPMPLVWNLQMARWRKVALTITFGMGLVVCAITVTRLVIAAKLTANDLTYDLARLAIVSDLEPLLGIIVACAPLFPPTFRSLVGATRKKFSTGSNTSDSKKHIMKGAGSSKFQVLDDSYHLTGISKGRNDTKITSSNSQPESLMDSREMDHREGSKEGQNINVKRGWEVRMGMPAY